MVAKITKWTPERVAILAELMNRGLTYAQIGKHMDETGTAVRGAAQRHALMRPERLQRGQAWSRKDYDTLEALLEQNLPFVEIGKRMGRTYNGVRCAVSRLGLTDPDRRRWRLRDDWAEIEPIIVDCIEAELMGGPQIIRRLAALGYTMTTACLHNHLRGMDPSLRQRLRRNAERRRNARHIINGKRRTARARQQRQEKAA